MSQRDKILKLFEGGGWVRVQEMNPIAYRYGAIMFNLRKEGYMFTKRRQYNSLLEEWKLVARPGQIEVTSTPRGFTPRLVIDEASVVTPEQVEAIRKRLSLIKENHGQINS